MGSVYRQPKFNYRNHRRTAPRFDDRRVTAHPLPIPVGPRFYQSNMEYMYDERFGNPGWVGLGIANSITRAMGFSFLSSFFSESFGNTNPFDALRLFVAGTIIETGRRFCYWAFERFKIRQFPVLFIYGVLS